MKNKTKKDVYQNEIDKQNLHSIAKKTNVTSYQRKDVKTLLKAQRIKESKDEMKLNLIILSLSLIFIIGALIVINI